MPFQKQFIFIYCIYLFISQNPGNTTSPFHKQKQPQVKKEVGAIAKEQQRQFPTQSNLDGAGEAACDPSNDGEFYLSIYRNCKFNAQIISQPFLIIKDFRKWGNKEIQIGQVVHKDTRCNVGLAFFHGVMAR